MRSRTFGRPGMPHPSLAVFSRFVQRGCARLKKGFHALCEPCTFIEAQRFRPLRTGGQHHLVATRTPCDVKCLSENRAAKPPLPPIAIGHDIFNNAIWSRAARHVRDDGHGTGRNENPSAVRNKDLHQTRCKQARPNLFSPTKSQRRVVRMQVLVEVEQCPEIRGNSFSDWDLHNACISIKGQ